MPPMDTDGEALTADDLEIFSAFADDAMDEGLCLSSAATPAVGYDGPWVQVGRGGGESGGLLDLDMPYTPMQPTAVVGGFLDTNAKADMDWSNLEGSTSSSSTTTTPNTKPLKDRTLVMVFEGTIPGIRGPRAEAYLARTTKHIRAMDGGDFYEVEPVLGACRQVRMVPGYAVEEQKSVGSSGQRVKGKESSLQKRARIQSDKDKTFLAAELKKAKKQNKQLLQKFNMAMKENKTMKEERAALQSLVSGKGIDSTKKPARAVLRILEPLMKVARESLAVDYSALEKQVERLGRQVSHREREVAVLLGKLRLRLSAEERLRDRKNRALREKRSSDAQNLTLQEQ